MSHTCAIVGINWGDEGKGKMVDLLSSQYDFVVRYQGGSNAGHTVVNEYGKFALNLMPSGVFHKNVVNLLGNGTVVDLEHLCGEIDKLHAAGITVDENNLKISERATIVFPFHKDQDALEEARLSDAKYGSTKRGISPVYGDKYMKKGIMVGDLLLPETLDKHLDALLDMKNLVLANVYHAKTYTKAEIMEWLEKYGGRLKKCICNGTELLTEGMKAGKNVLFEAQLGALRDVDFGIYPYVSSSSPLAAYAPLGAGIPGTRVDRVVGIVKAYSTCVGEGPFVVEWFGEQADKLREVGAEYGAATGRPRRVGPLDIPATRYGVQMQGATELALTKLDCLSYMDEIPVCEAYEIDGKRVDSFPFTPYLGRAKPIMTHLPGWKCDITKLNSWEELPREARNYVEYLEAAVGCRVKYVSNGPERQSIIVR